RMAGHIFTGSDVRWESPAGLSVVWAEENTRASIWDAMHRKETYATSGVRIKLRFFGGWDYQDGILAEQDWVKQAYAGGATMGSDLPSKPGEAKAPSFVVWAVKDPTAANLDRIQVVKGWTKDGQSFEKIYDVVWSGDRKPNFATGEVPAIESTVDLEKATYSDTVGATELKTVWTDPDFDPSQHAFYYARALEIPTPRWSTIQARQLGIEPPGVVPATQQERAWSSPIWYTPTTELREAATPGLTVADLTRNGAKALTEDELKTLIVGKAIWVRNNVTGEDMKVRYDEDGSAAILHVGRDALLPSLFGDLPQRSYQTTAANYDISGGKIITYISGTPITMAVYKSTASQGGNTPREQPTYFGARSNEFGHANYEILLKGPENLVELPKTDDIPDDEQSKYLNTPEKE
ncbi:DUF3604 domain-containing protein, partial [Bauldia litoralis]